MKKINLNLKKIFLGVGFKLCFVATSYAIVKPGQQTFPLPLYNDLRLGCCYQNSVMQSLLACPKFCLHFDQMQVSVKLNDLEFYIKGLRENLKNFSCDKNRFLKFLNRPYSCEDNALRTEIQKCSLISSTNIKNYLESSCRKEYEIMGYDGCCREFIIEYLFLKRLFESDFLAFYYFGEQAFFYPILSLKFNLLKEKRSYDLDKSSKYCEGILKDVAANFVLIHIPKIDLFMVIFESNINILSLDDFTAKLEKFFSLQTQKNYKLRSVAFKIERTLLFERKITCSEKNWKRQLKKGYIPADYFDSVSEIRSEIWGHCASYVNFNGGWYFVDDFFREYLDKPLIRPIFGRRINLFDDMVNKEHGERPILFFSTDL